MKSPTNADRRGARDSRAKRQAENRARKRNRGGAVDPRSTRKWTSLSKRRRQRFPICETPGCDLPSEQTDHVIPVEENPKLAFRWSNLQALCHPCHARKSAEERKAKRSERIRRHQEPDA